MTTDTFTITPLSDHTEPYGLPRCYPQAPGRNQRIDGDQALLIGLHEACHRLRDACAVRDLSEDTLRSIVEKTEDEHFGSWQLAGSPDDPIIDRLNEHFRPLQEAWLSSRVEREAYLERRAVEGAELDRRIAAQRDADTRAMFGLPPAA